MVGDYVGILSAVVFVMCILFYFILNIEVPDASSPSLPFQHLTLLTLLLPIHNSDPGMNNYILATRITLPCASKFYAVQLWIDCSLLSAGSITA